MLRNTEDSISIFRFEKFASHERVSAFVSTRTGGVSKPPFESLNLSYRKDDRENVDRNRALLSSALKIPQANMTFGKQVHGNTVTTVFPNMRGRGAFDYDSALEASDALATNEPNICLMVLVADCVPLAFFDPKRRAIAVAHSGWKGALQFISQRVVQRMGEDYGSKPQDILVGVGPSNGACCYWIKPDALAAIRGVYGYPNKYISKSQNIEHLDVESINIDQLLDCGVPAANIEVANMCTCHNRDLFFSERCDGPTGRFALGITLS